VSLFALSALLPVVLGAAPVLEPAVLEQDEYAESFTFIADLDDGTYVQLQLVVTNLGPGSRTGACRALVVRAGKEPWTKGERFDSDEWRHSASESKERLEIGPCYAEAGEQLEARTRVGKADVSLRYPHKVAPVSPPSHTIAVRKRQHRTWLLAPFSRVSARIALPGEPPVELAGGGYADHSRGNVPANKLARRWLRFRGLRGSERVLLLAREGLSGSFGPAWIWIEGSEPLSFESFALRRAGKKKAPQWSASLAGGLEGEIVSTSQLYRYAPVEELGALGWLVAPIVGSPVTYTHRARLALKGPAPVSGILEVSLLEE
jgi:hypothetical protein